MAQASKVLTSPTLASFPVTFTPQQLPTGIRSIELDNGSNLTLTLEADGAIIRVVAPYVARFALNTGGSWQRLTITAAGSPNSTDSIVLTAFDTVVVPPLLPSFGPSAWGAGAVPNALADVHPGDQFLAWQVEQIIDLLTGVMTGQPVTVNNSLSLTGTSGFLVTQAGGSVLASKTTVQGAGQIALVFVGTTGVAGDQKAQLLYDSGQALAGGGWVFQNLSDAGDFVANLVTILKSGNVGLGGIVAPTSQLHANGRITSSATGASGKPLLNFVPGYVGTTTISGSGNTVGVTDFALTGVPASAEAIVGHMHTGTVPAGGFIQLFGKTAGGFDANEAGDLTSTFLRMHPTIAAHGGHAGYQTVGMGANNWSFTIDVLGYWEPS